MRASNISLHPFEGANWQAALEALAGPGAGAFQQSAQYGDVMRALGRKVARVEIRSGTVRIGLVQMIARSKLWLISRGPVFGPDVFLGQMSRRLYNRRHCAGWRAASAL
ncbi:hypothetical protein [Thioclava sp.]|uniref:hypothetical protein n=1 Tax=Thioclava sp. TaxID=1933450 RepID=UPI003AA9B211